MHEPVHTNGMFRKAFAKRRTPYPCNRLLRVAETDGRQTATQISAGGSRALRLRRHLGVGPVGGKEILSASIIVGAPNPLAAAVHDRMPVILDPADYDRWLALEAEIEELPVAPQTVPAERMQALAVNRVKNDNETCIEPR